MQPDPDHVIALFSLAADVGEDAGGDALGRATPLVLVDLIPDQQVEEAPHPVLHVVGQRVAGRAGLVAACQRGEPQSAQVCFLRFRSASVRGTPTCTESASVNYARPP